MQAIIRLGDCSGVLVGPHHLLTSAHCVKPGLEQVTIAGQTFHVNSCEANPGYRPLQASFDIAVCQLATPAAVEAIALDEGPAPQAGQAVTLAGYGLPAALTHAPPELRAVETAVGRVDARSFDVGTDDRTACLGDSGGPVLIRRGGVPRVMGILTDRQAPYVRAPPGRRDSSLGPPPTTLTWRVSSTNAIFGRRMRSGIVAEAGRGQNRVRAAEGCSFRGRAGAATPQDGL